MDFIDLINTMTYLFKLFLAAENNIIDIVIYPNKLFLDIENKLFMDIENKLFMDLKNKLLR
jgi:hypothetical protein